MSDDEYMMELPLDADGVPIRVGDVVRHKHTGAEYKVLGVSDEYFFSRSIYGEGMVRCCAEMYTHKKRELEDALKDYLYGGLAVQAMFVAESMDSDEYDSTLEELARKTAKEIRGMKWA